MHFNKGLVHGWVAPGAMKKGVYATQPESLKDSRSQTLFGNALVLETLFPRTAVGRPCAP
jgi:hypothetical protein